MSPTPIKKWGDDWTLQGIRDSDFGEANGTFSVSVHGCSVATARAHIWCTRTGFFRMDLQDSSLMMLFENRESSAFTFKISGSLGGAGKRIIESKVRVPRCFVVVCQNTLSLCA